MTVSVVTIGQHWHVDKLPLLPGVFESRVRAILDKAGGNEIASGKFASPQSSAALAVNSFGWFLD